MSQPLPASIVQLGDTSTLEHVVRRAMAGYSITVAGIGGSITAGAGASTVTNRWISLVETRLAALFRCEVNLVDAGISMTKSDYGALRAVRDIINKNVDVVFVDYAVNNSVDDAPSYDSLLRVLMNASPSIAVVPLMFCNCLQQGVQSTLIPIAQYYNLPIISYENAVLTGLASGTFTLAQVTSPDRVHPPDFGHALAAECVMDLFMVIRALVQAAGAPMRVPTPARPNVFDATTLISNKGLAGATCTGFSYIPDPGDFPVENVGALVSTTVGDQFSIPIEVGPKKIVWLMLAQSSGGKSGTIAVYVDSTLTNVTDCNRPSARAYSDGGEQILVEVAAGISNGNHTLSVLNQTSLSGATWNWLWICGIATA
jgi:hypothetical protein